MLRAERQSSTAAYAATVLGRMLEAAGRAAEGGVLDEVLASLGRVSERGDHGGPGWSWQFGELRTLLHAAVGVRVTAAEAGSSQAALKAAIATGEVVELPPQRLEDAQTRFDDLQVIAPECYRLLADRPLVAFCACLSAADCI